MELYLQYRRKDDRGGSFNPTLPNPLLPHSFLGSVALDSTASLKYLDHLICVVQVWPTCLFVCLLGHYQSGRAVGLQGCNGCTALVHLSQLRSFSSQLRSFSSHLLPPADSSGIPTLLPPSRTFPPLLSTFSPPHCLVFNLSHPTTRKPTMTRTRRGTKGDLQRSIKLVTEQHIMYVCASPVSTVLFEVVADTAT